MVFKESEMLRVLLLYVIVYNCLHILYIHSELVSVCTCACVCVYMCVYVCMYACEY